jgi:hypothetical protein
MTTDLDTLLARANPLPLDAARALELPDAELVAAITAESRVPGPRAPRAHRRRRMARRVGFAIALAGAAAIVLAALPSGSGPGRSTPGAPARAWAAELVRFAEASPLVLLGDPDWKVDHADESSATNGEMRFLHGDEPAPPAGELVVTEGQPIPKAFIEDTRRHASLNWRSGGIGMWKRDRGHEAAAHTRAPVLGATADVYEYRAAGQFRDIPDYHDITALWKDGGRVMEFRWAAPSMAAFKALLGDLRRVDTNAWLSAMPASVVKAADRGDAITAMLRGIPLPPGFDKTRIRGAKLTQDRYQLGASVAGTVACAWLRIWSQARRAGDTATVERAVAAMATSRHWPILREMSATGAYPEVLGEYVAAMPTGTWYGRSLERSADSALACSSLGVGLTGR